MASQPTNPFQSPRLNKNGWMNVSFPLSQPNTPPEPDPNAISAQTATNMASEGVKIDPAILADIHKTFEAKPDINADDIVSARTAIIDKQAQANQEGFSPDSGNPPSPQGIEPPQGGMAPMASLPDLASWRNARADQDANSPATAPKGPSPF